jgi:peroxiredoxin
LLSDRDHRATIAYGVAEADAERSPRKSVLIGPDRKIAVSYDAVKPADHPGQVLDDLDRLK